MDFYRNFATIYSLMFICNWKPLARIRIIIGICKKQKKVTETKRKRKGKRVVRKS